jgi:CTP synthase
MVVEYARNVLGLIGANSTEFDESTPHPVVKLQAYQELVEGFGGTARLGNWTTKLAPGCKTAQLYGSEEIIQRHRHRWEISSAYDYKDFRVVGLDEATNLIEVMELSGHPFYVGVQFHPECTPDKGPLFKGLVEAAEGRRLRPARLHGGNLREVITKGTPGSFLESINLDNEDELRRLVGLSSKELDEFGVSENERAVLRNFLAVLDEKRSVMAQLDANTTAIQASMREIRFEAVNRGGELTSSEARELISLEARLEKQRSILREMRDEYSNRLMRWDSAMAAEGRNVAAERLNEDT